MRENRKDVAEYRAKTDFTVVAQRALYLKPGQRVRLESREFFPGVGYKDTRIVSIDRPVNEPGSMTLTLSDVLAKGRPQPHRERHRAGAADDPRGAGGVSGDRALVGEHTGL